MGDFLNLFGQNKELTPTTSYCKLMGRLLVLMVCVGGSNPPEPSWHRLFLWWGSRFHDKPKHQLGVLPTLRLFIPKLRRAQGFKVFLHSACHDALNLAQNCLTFFPLLPLGPSLAFLFSSARERICSFIKFRGCKLLQPLRWWIVESCRAGVEFEFWVGPQAGFV